MTVNIYEQNPYTTLGIKPNASSEEIRKAYIKMAGQYHPDRNQGDHESEQKFKAISLAYAILSDPLTKAAYEKNQRVRRNVYEQSKGQYTNHQQSYSHSNTSTNFSRTTNPYATHDSSSGARQKEFNGNGAASFEEVLANFFKSEKGKVTLDDLKQEMEKAGFKFNSQAFSQWFDGQPKSVLKNKGIFKTILSRLNFKSAVQEKNNLYDIQYKLPIDQQTAYNGTNIEVNYSRGQGESPQKLQIRIPSCAHNGMKLRLAGQGRLKPNQSRGDLILTLTITSK